MHGTDESVFEEVAYIGELNIPQAAIEGEETNSTDIGQWGEQLVHNYLLAEKERENSDIIEVRWLNKSAESGQPYDFVVTVRQEDPAGGGSFVLIDDDNDKGDSACGLRHVFIEVKATKAENKAFFEISLPELKVADQKGQDYHVYRVYNAGVPEKVRMVKLQNLASKLQNKQVKICMII